MRFRNTPLVDEGIKDKVFQFMANNVLITVAKAELDDGTYLGCAVQSPKEHNYNNKKRAYAIARGRLRKAIVNNIHVIFPEQRWVSFDEFKKGIEI